MKKLFSLLLLLHLTFQSSAQVVISKPVNFHIKPYLQDATPHSITVLWETTSEMNSIVEWGTTKALNNSTNGVSYDINHTDARIHEVKLTGLKRLTLYYYRVKSDSLVSDIYQFKTPPFKEDNIAFNMVAMSDMQIDNGNPNKFSEIVEEGIISYFDSKFKGLIPENLALVMIPGDLVTEGTHYEQWKKHFFDPGAKLFSQVPIYPVPGNHERNSTYFFKYFSLPKNGSPAYDEHWWYKDYGNVRIIGLDSNEGYRNEIQLSWLDTLLHRTSFLDSIDFVFAQLHHPHKSELWLAGESDFTGKVIERLEAFSSKTGKPSVHFFGHTHGYSRGQSRDHKHLWVNVATAGGNIDYWGEFAQKNYEEFTVTQDEYGFIMVEIDPNLGDPKMTIKRISRGNENKFRDNEIRDSVTVFRYDKNPSAPSVTSPTNLVTNAKHITLRASPFRSDRLNALHGASHWQVSLDKEFKKLIIDSWRQFEDWYVYQNLQKNDNLTDEKLPKLESGVQYYWRVRYRDRNLNWSEWSQTATFQTSME